MNTFKIDHVSFSTMQLHTPVPIIKRSAINLTHYCQYNISHEPEMIGTLDRFVFCSKVHLMKIIAFKLEQDYRLYIEYWLCISMYGIR